MWWDREIRAGSDFALEIDREIAAARVVVVLWSEASQQSAWVRDEGAYGRDRQKLIPICLEDAEPPLGFRQVQSLRLGKATGRNVVLADLTAAVRGFVSRADSADAKPIEVRRRSRGPIIAAIGVAALVLAGLLVRGLMNSTEREAPVLAPFAMAPHPVSQADQSIAVLPFADMSENRDQEYLADGMTEEIINLLANAPGLLVAARTSSFYFKGKDTKLDEIARELGVAHLLEGSIRKTGDRLRVTAQLVRADTGFHLWSDTFDRELRDLFMVQDEIAKAVAQALQIRLKGGELNRRKGGTQNLEAYELLLKAYEVSYQNNATSFDEGARYAQAAIDRDPNYGLAWSQLAIAVMGNAGNSLMDANEGYARARELALHALELSPEIAEAHATLSGVYQLLDWDWAAAKRELRVALALDPTDPAVLLAAAQYENALGNWKEAEQYALAGLKRDPLSSWLLTWLGNTYYGSGRLDEAEALYRKVLEIEPDYQWTRLYLGKTLQEKGEMDAVVAIAEEETDPDLLLYSRPMTYWMMGRKAEADAALEQLIAEIGSSNAYAIAQHYAYRDEPDRAFEWLNKAHEQRNSGLIEIVGEPLFRNLCGDPRFDAFLRRMGMPVVKSYPFRRDST